MSIDSAMFNDWLDLSQDLKYIKEKEMRLRKEIAADILEGLVPPCKKKLDIDGVSIQVDNGVSHNVDREVVNAIFADLSAADKEALKFTPELKLREYKKLPKESLLHEAITKKPSAPTIKVI